MVRRSGNTLIALDEFAQSIDTPPFRAGTAHSTTNAAADALAHSSGSR